MLGSVIPGDFSRHIEEVQAQVPAWNRFVELGGIKAFCDLVVFTIDWFIALMV